MINFRKNIAQVNQLCKQYRVKSLYIFGSAITDKFNSGSDVDLLVDFESIDSAEYADNYFDLKFSLEDLFNREVDLLEEKAVRNPFVRQSIESHKQLVYGY